MIRKHLYMWVWGFILVVIIILLTAFGMQYKKIIPYKKIERKMINVTKKMEMNLPDSKITFDLDELKINDLSLKNNKLIKNCKGNVKVKKTKMFKKKYKATLTCKNYKTSNIFA